MWRSAAVRWLTVAWYSVETNDWWGRRGIHSALDLLSGCLLTISGLPMRLPLPLFCVASLCFVVPATLLAQTYAPGQGPAPLSEAIGFGTAVAMAENEILIGRPGVVPGFPMPPASAGAVQVYRRGPGGRWSQVGVVTAKGLKIDAGFGHALATDGKLLAVGAPVAEERRGAVYIFERDAAGRWVERAKLTTSDAAAGDRFGRSLALHGGVLLVGSPGHAESQGRAVLFRRTGTGWAREAILEGANARATGAAVLLEKDAAYVSAPVSDSAAGAVLEFKRDGSGWKQVSRVVAASREHPALFGMTLARDGQDLLVGAPFSSGGIGSIHVLRQDGSTWREAQKMITTGVGFSTQLGAALGASSG